jgi:type II secretory pathway component PulF
MAHFFYKAKKGPTEIVQGEIDAENEDAALGKISGMGLVPIKLTPAGAQGDLASKETRGRSAGDLLKDSAAVRIEPQKVTIPYKDLNIFTRQFAILLKASVPLLKIFEVLKNQTQNRKFRQVLTQIQDSLRQGASLSDTIALYPRIFSEVFISMVHSGEVSGTLEQVLMRLADFSEKEAEVRSKVQSAMVYPLFLLLVGVGTVFILLTFVMPRLMTLFADLGTELPTVTRVIVGISKFCQLYWIPMLGAAAFLVVWFRSRGLSKIQKKALDRFLIKAPLMGTLIKKADTARFLRSIELLYENGIPLFKAVEVATQTVSSSLIREQLEKVPEKLEGGATLAGALGGVSYLSEFVTQMVSIGEESGQLTAAVRETASFYEQETNQFIKIATALIEPAMILVIGVVIGFIVVSMLLPIFDIHVLAQ